MATSKDLIPKSGVRLSPISGIAPEDSPFPGSKETRSFNKQLYSLRDIILGGTLPQYSSPVPSLVSRSFADLELEQETSANVTKSLRNSNCRYFEPQGLWVPFEILTRNAVDQNGRTYSVRDTDSDTGSYLVQTKVEPTIGEALTPYAATLRAGAEVISDLRSDFAQPVWQGYSSPSGVAENISVTNNLNTIPSPTFTLQQMVPVRVNADLLVSRQLVVQSTPDFERWFRKQVLQAIAAKLDFYILNGLGASQNQPLGILNYPQQGANSYLVNKILPSFAFGGAPTYNELVAAVSAVTSQNVVQDGTFGWVIGEQTWKVWKETPIITGYPRYLIENEKAVDKPVYQTNNLSSVTGSTEQIVFGRWSDCIVGFWGSAMDIVSNPYTYAASGSILVSVNVLCNFVLLHANAFVISSDSGAQ